MITVEEIKNKAVEYAKRFSQDNFELLKDDMEKYNVKKWYLIEKLANIYYNLINKTITREEAKQQQTLEFEFANLYFGN